MYRAGDACQSGHLWAQDGMRKIRRRVDANRQSRVTSRAGTARGRRDQARQAWHRKQYRRRRAAGQRRANQALSAPHLSRAVEVRRSCRDKRASRRHVQALEGWALHGKGVGVVLILDWHMPATRVPGRCWSKICRRRQQRPTFTARHEHRGHECGQLPFRTMPRCRPVSRSCAGAHLTAWPRDWRRRQGSASAVSEAILGRAKNRARTTSAINLLGGPVEE